MARTYRLKAARRAAEQYPPAHRRGGGRVSHLTGVRPSRSSIVAIAERAGVDVSDGGISTTEALFTACSSHYRTQNPPPDPKPRPANRLITRGSAAD